MTAARAYLPAPDLQSKLSFIDLCCILTEETKDKLTELTTSYEQEPDLHLTHHAIPRSQVDHLHSTIDAVVAHFQQLQALIHQQKTERDDEEADDEGPAFNRPVAALPALEQRTHSADVEEMEQADAEELRDEEGEQGLEEDEAASDKENDSPAARRNPTPSSFRCSPHPLKGKATPSSSLSRTSIPPLSPLTRDFSAATSTPHSSTSPLHSHSPVSSPRHPSLRTPSSPYVRGSSSPSSASLPPTPATPSLSLLGLSEATLQMLRLVPHPNGRTSTSSLDSLDEEALRTRPELPSTLLVRRGRKAREDGGRGEGRLSVESEGSERSAPSPPVPAFASVLARTPHTSIRTAAVQGGGATPASPASPLLAPQHLTFDDAITATLVV